MTRAEHVAVLRVLKMVQEFLDAGPDEIRIAAAFDSGHGAPKAWRELQQHVAGAIGIVEAVKPSTMRPRR